MDLWPSLANSSSVTSMDFAWLYLIGLGIALLGVVMMALSANRGGPSFTTGMHVIWIGFGVVLLWIVVMYLTGPVPRKP